MVVAAVVVIAVAGVAAAAPEQNENDDEPQAGTVVVSIAKTHNCHLTLRHSMRQKPVLGLTI